MGFDYANQWYMYKQEKLKKCLGIQTNPLFQARKSNIVVIKKKNISWFWYPCKSQSEIEVKWWKISRICQPEVNYRIQGKNCVDSSIWIGTCFSYEINIVLINSFDS